MKGFVVEQGRVPREAREGGGRDRAGEVEHGGVGVQPVRDRELDPARLYAKSVRARSRHGRFERRNGGRRRGQLRDGRTRQRYRQLDSRAFSAPGARRHPIDDGPDEPRRGRPAEPARGHCRTDGADARRRGRGLPGDRRRRSGRSRHARASTRSLGCGRAAIQRRFRTTAPRWSARRIERRAHRRPPSGVRAGHDRSRDGVLSSWRRSRTSKRAGATIVDPATVDLAQVSRPQGAGSCGGFKYDINRYLAAHGDRVPVHTLDEIVRSRRYHPSVRAAAGARAGTDRGQRSRNSGVQSGGGLSRAFRAAVLKTMDAHKLSAFVYPTWSNPPRLIGDLNTPHGDNSQVFSPTTGFPAINVPMGYTRGGTLPAGITFFGTRLGRGDADRARLFVRAGHEASPPSGDDAATSTPARGRARDDTATAIAKCPGHPRRRTLPAILNASACRSPARRKSSSALSRSRRASRCTAARHGRPRGVRVAR